VTSSGSSGQKNSQKSLSKQEKPCNKSSFRSHSHPCQVFFIPSVFNLLSFASHSPPSFLHTPVSASLRSLCSPLGVADDRRLGGSTLSHCSDTASLICALMLLLIFSTHCGTYWHRATQAVTMHMHTGLHTHNC